MGKLFKNMKPYWKSIVLIFALLLAQAFCDLSLPSYTSGLIDTGIQNSGIEYAVPEQISQSSYQAVSAFLTDGERETWNASYTLDADGVYRLTDAAKKDLKALDETFATPIALYYSATNLTDEQKAQIAGEFASSDALTDEQKAAMAQGAQASADAASLTDEQKAALAAQSGFSLAALRPEMEEKLASMGTSFLHSSAVAFVKAEYEALGVDLSAIRSAYLWRTGARMVGMTLLMALCAVLVGLLASRVGAGIGRDLRKKVFGKVVGFSNAEINQFSTASLITRSTNDIQQVQFVSTILLRIILYAPVLAVGGIIMVLRTSSGMEWIIAVAEAAVFALVMILMQVAMPRFKKMQTLVDKVNLIAREILTGLPVIRAFNREKLEEERFDGANKDLTKTMLFTNRVMTTMMPAMMLIMNGVSVLIVWVAAHRIDAGAMEVGAMTAFITYTMQIIMSFLMLSMVSIMLPRAAVAAGRIDEVLETKATISDKAQPAALPAPRGVLAFHHVDFHYPGAQDNTLSDIDFTAEPGKTTAIIGSTGCGKSTLLNLILRFYDVTGGSITLDGVDVRDLTQKDLRAAIGYVPQKAVLFSGTIDSNLRYGGDDISETAAKEAAHIAQATEFINQKPDGYESPIAQGGSNVSGGQKQRLSIARAIAKDPKVYLFDDSFSALDFKTDAALRKALGPKVKDSTVLIVAQRISTILYADQILVLDDGRIVGKGTHAELMENCEEYRQIARSQLSEAELSKNIEGAPVVSGGKEE